MNKATPLSADTKTLVLSVEGMTCAACAARIERVLNKEDSVKDVVVNFPLKKAVLEVNPDDENSDEYIQKIRSIGYSAKEEVSEEKKNNITKFSIPLISLLLTLTINPLIQNNQNLLALGIGSLIIFFFGRKFHLSALKNLKILNFNMDTLISIGSLSSFVIGVLPNNGELMYLETGGFIISFILLGKTIEEISIKSSISISDSIIESIPKDVNVYDNQTLVRKPLDLIDVGELIVIKKGEIAPLDGIVRRGSSEVDESIISGESVPLLKKSGDNVISGSINLGSEIEIEVTKKAGDTTINYIEKLILKAQTGKPEVQDLVDRVTNIFVPSILILSFINFLIKALVFDNSFPDTISSTIAILVVACPCALGLATPIVLFRTASISNRNGFIFKNFDYLQRFNQLDTIIFDKTGTLTSGIFKIESILDDNGEDAGDEILRILASVEQNSNHPIAKSILLESEIQGLELLPVEKFVETPGVGVSGIVQNKNITVTKSVDNLINDLILKINDKQYRVKLVEDETVNKELIKSLSKDYELEILSGDKSEKVKEIGINLNIEKVYGDQSPEDKLEYIKNKQRNKKVGFVGDGINDSPALQQANVSLSFAQSTQIAQSVSDIIIFKGGLEKLGSIFNISKNSNRRIAQNLFFAFIYNVIMIPIAVSGNIMPSMAALAMALSSLSVVINSSRKL